MMGSSATSMSTIFNRFVNISPPGIDILNVANGEGVDNLPPEDVFIKISFRLDIGDLIDSTIMQLLPVPFAKEMVDTLNGRCIWTEPLRSCQPAAQAPSQHQRSCMTAPTAMQAAWQPACRQPMCCKQPMHSIRQCSSRCQQYAAACTCMDRKRYGGNAESECECAACQFANFQGAPLRSSRTNTNLNLLLDIPLKVTVELGRTQKQIKDILGTVARFDYRAGQACR